MYPGLSAGVSTVTYRCIQSLGWCIQGLSIARSIKGLGLVYPGFSIAVSRVKFRFILGLLLVYPGFNIAVSRV